MKQVMRAAFATLALGIGALAAPANASVLDNVQVKFGAIAVLPDESATISGIGGGADISDEIVPSVQLEYFFNDHVSAELLCCIAQHDVAAINTSLGRVDLGEVTHFPPTLTLKYRWTNFGNIEPYVGAGVNYTHFFNEELPAVGPVTNISYDDSIGPAIQIGADIRLNDHWSINIDARRIWINSEVSLNNGAIRADVDIDPWVIATGVGYRF